MVDSRMCRLLERLDDVEVVKHIPIESAIATWYRNDLMILVSSRLVEDLGLG